MFTHTKISIRLYAVFMFFGSILLSGQAWAQATQGNFFLAKKLLAENRLDSCVLFTQRISTENDYEQFTKNSVLSRAYFLQGNIDQALALATALEDEKTPESLLFVARLWAEKGDAQQAVKKLAEYLRMKNKRSPKQILTDSSFLKVAETKAWKNLWKTAWYKKFEYQFDEALFQYRFGRVSEAQATLAEVVSKKRYAPAWDMWAQIEFEAGRLEAAIAAQEKAVAANKKAFAYQEKLVDFLLEDGQWKNAKRTLDLLMKKQPFEIEHHRRLAHYLIGTKQDDDLVYQSLARYAKFMVPTEANLERLAELYFLFEDYPNAMRYYSKCIALSKKAKYFKGRGKCYFQARVLTYALRDLNMALDQNPNDKEVNFLLAEVFFIQKKIKFACSNWKHAVKLGYQPAVLRYNKHCNK